LGVSLRKSFLFTVISTVYLYSYTVISHKPIDYFIPEYRVVIDATVKNFSGGIKSGKVHFRSDRNREFFSVEMSCAEDICRGVLPAPSSVIVKIDYFISVLDRTGEIYKTQIFSVGKSRVPKWHLTGSHEPIRVYSISGDISKGGIVGFSDRLSVKEIPVESRVETKKAKTIHSMDSNMLIPMEEFELNRVTGSVTQKSKSREKVNLSGTWIVKRSLSTCTTGISSQKIIEITAKNGKIVSDRIYPNGTKFLYNPNSWFTCKLVDDTSENILIGERSEYNYYDFLKSLKSDLSDDEVVELHQFSPEKISFQIKRGSVSLWTTYLRQSNSGRSF
jgi:hypothetical protein